tara:strand:+ start:2994 stop:4112 length:1119 start_codon:yes stop_codon:yes gene_type:complete
MRRVLLSTGLLLLVLLVPPLSANPGGTGDANRDASCGGSCHGDPGLSEPSSAILSFSQDRDSPYVGGPISISVTVTEMELSSRAIIGVFLLSDTYGVSDTPQDSGWTILSNGEGGSTNYVETYVLNPDEGATITWSLLAPNTEGIHQLYAGVHHGGGGAARMMLSSAYNVTVGPIPENLPQMLSWDAMNSRPLGESTELSLPVVNATSVALEYRINEGPIISSEATKSGEYWVVNLPASLSDISLSYRIIMSNEEFSESTGWIVVSSEVDGYNADIFAVRLQSFALMLGSIALCISIQRRMARTLSSPISKPEEAILSADQTNIVDSTDTLMATHATSLALNLADPRRPPGWTDEQWVHYGPDYIKDNGGGL